MKKFIVIALTLLILLPGIAFAGSIDVGVSITPFSLIKGEDDSSAADLYGETESSFFEENSLGLHLGYSFWWLFYASADFNIVPDWYVENATSNYGADEGILAPGIVSYFDVGIRPIIGPIVLMAEVGLNYLYIHSNYVDEGEGFGGTGVNMRLGGGLYFKPFVITAVGTVFFASFDNMTETMTAIADGDEMVQEEFLSSLTPSIIVSLKF